MQIVVFPFHASFSVPGGFSFWTLADQLVSLFFVKDITIYATVTSPHLMTATASLGPLSHMTSIYSFAPMLVVTQICTIDVVRYRSNGLHPGISPLY